MDKKQVYPIAALFAICAVLVIGISWWVGSDAPATDTSATNRVTETTLTPEALPEYEETMHNKNNPVAVLETTAGTIEIELYEDAMPITAGNFKKLVNEGFYDGIKFHRVIDGFMIQGGDPNTKESDKSVWGQGGPGYNLKAEFNSRSHLRGIVSMARASDPDSAGSQFFIVTSDSTFLDKQYTVFAEVVEGLEIADKIVNLPRDGNDCPKEEAKMLRITTSD